jgi:serine/threonine protein phosphatase PrpC
VQLELARVSLTGHRAENQDRVEILSQGPCTLLIVVDGMGGHAEGAKASEVTIARIAELFAEAGQPLLDPQGFLIRALTMAHEEVVRLGEGITVEQRPRATCAICLIQDQNAYCAHVGDSRIYQLRHKAIVHRSRDHSHVELLLSEGLIDEDEVNSHPMRNFVECCLGGDEPLPDMTIAARQTLRSGDVLLLCSDGLWSGVDDEELTGLAESGTALEQSLLGLADRAMKRNAPASDNISAVAARLNGLEL